MIHVYAEKDIMELIVEKENVRMIATIMEYAMKESAIAKRDMEEMNVQYY